MRLTLLANGSDSDDDHPGVPPAFENAWHRGVANTTVTSGRVEKSFHVSLVTSCAALNGFFNSNAFN